MKCKNISRRVVAYLLLLSMVLCIVTDAAPVNFTTTAKAAYSISNPRVTGTSNTDTATWDCIWFGNYWQSNSTNKEPIKWRVLSVNGDNAFIVADKALDCQPYNTAYTDVTWETCTLRTWLNGTFINNAFSSTEQAAIKTTNVVNEDNIDYGTNGGNNTSDKIFLLSQNEVRNANYGFNSTYDTYCEGRQCKATAYAISKGCSVSSSDSYAGNCSWWLRSPGNYSYDATDVYSSGWGNYNIVNSTYIGVRPALNINLSSSAWSYAGTVTAKMGDGSGAVEDEVAAPTPTPTVKPTSTPTVAPSSDSVSNPRVTGTSNTDTATWDCIWFGNYWQSNSTNKEPIKWRVLSVNGDNAFIVADKALDCQPYNTTYTDVTWETCTLRAWLNGTFINNAFSSVEQAAIKTTNVVNEDNIDYGTNGGNNTSDKIFLLSQNEVCNANYGFNSTYGTECEGRQCKATAYAKSKGCYVSSGTSYAGNGDCWLRSPGNNRYYAADVYYYGWGYYSLVSYTHGGVRPALNINLSSSAWSYAGTVTAKMGDGSGAVVSEVAPEATTEPTKEPEATTEPTKEPEATTEPTKEPEATTEPTKEPEATTEPTKEPEATTEPTKEPVATNAPTTAPTVTQAPAQVTAAPADNSGITLPAVNDVLSDAKSKGKYKVVSVDSASKLVCVSYIAPTDKNVAKADVPDSIGIAGMTVKVTSIEANAFKNCKKLKSVTIGKNIAKIGKNAFSGCKNLKSIKIKATGLKSVGAKAFAKINANAKVKVPKKQLKSYVKLLKKAGIKGKKQKITK